MADPLTIFGAVASAVQFVEFTGKLIYGTSVIYKHAQRGDDPNSSVETITKCLNQLSQELGQSLESRKSSEEQLSEHENLMQNLCQSWGSFRKALTVVWKESEIETLQKQLDSFRQQISLHILKSIRYEFSSFVINL
jgi:hypothetical protein